MEWIQNQPVLFGSPSSCSDDEHILQIVDNSDITQVQFTAEPCSDAIQLMPDPNFADDESWTLGTGWSIADGLICHTGSSTVGASSVYQLDTTKRYQINITVDSISTGTSVQVSFGSEIVGYITSAGQYTFYGFPVTYFGESIILLPQGGEIEMCISEITVYEVLTNAIIAIYNTDNVYQTELRYDTTPDAFVFSKNTVTVSIDWSDLEVVNGCYYLCFLDPCENTNGQNYPAVITNGDFAKSIITGLTDGWTLGDDWINTPPMTGFYALGGALTQEDVFSSFSNNYCISVTVQNLAGANAKVDVYFGTNLAGTIIANGTTQITNNCEGNFNLSFVMQVNSYVEILSVEVCEITPADYECNATSNTFKLADYSDSCTLVVNACNNSDGLGFVFEDSGFTPRVRLEAKLRQAKYINERSVFQNSVGKKSNYYFTGRKAKNLCLDLQPEYIHDFLRLLLGFDNVYIDNQPYFVEDDEYNVEYSDVHDNIGKVKLLVSEKTQNVKNTDCTDDENVCTLPPNYLLRADDLSQFVTQTTGDKIVIGG